MFDFGMFDPLLVKSWYNKSWYNKSWYNKPWLNKSWYDRYILIRFELIHFLWQTTNHNPTNLTNIHLLNTPQSNILTSN
jgi:hypothetical protein